MLYFQSDNSDFKLYQGDCLQILPTFSAQSINMICTDPPYFLSNNGLTVKNGRIQSVNKGNWDRFSTDDKVYEFTVEWLKECHRLLVDNGTIWISGTHHNIFTLGRVLSVLGFKILNMITWQKPNPPPNFSCRYFTYSTEWIIWARKFEKVPHYFDYELMKKLNGGKQMKDVWQLPAVSKWEKEQGGHPTQKPLGLLSRIILCSSREQDIILDPFSGSATTGIAAQILNRQFIGIEQESEFLELAKRRQQALTHDYKHKLKQHIRQQISII